MRKLLRPCWLLSIQLLRSKLLRRLLGLKRLLANQLLLLTGCLQRCRLLPRLLSVLRGELLLLLPRLLIGQLRGEHQWLLPCTQLQLS